MVLYLRNDTRFTIKLIINRKSCVGLRLVQCLTPCMTMDSQNTYAVTDNQKSNYPRTQRLAYVNYTNLFVFQNNFPRFLRFYVFLNFFPNVLICGMWYQATNKENIHCAGWGRDWQIPRHQDFDCRMVPRPRGHQSCRCLRPPHTTTHRNTNRTVNRSSGSTIREFRFQEL